MADSGKQATWGGRFREGPSTLMQEFSESVSFDQALITFDILGSKAHAAMLRSVGLLSETEEQEICQGLDAVFQDIVDGRQQLDPSLEDIHMNVEQALGRKTSAAAKLHTGRSRNDQIATDMRLWFKHQTEELLRELDKLLVVLVDFAERSQMVYIPGYTHLQRAQPVSLAHHLLAYAEMFGRDRRRFERLREDANLCPLGSGAIAGTTLPIDRAYVALRLGFVDEQGLPRLTANSMDAVSDRDLFFDFAHACAVCGIHFSRLAEDMILWNSAEFGFISLPDAYTTGSSLMPQKKNPDSFELLRGKSARLTGNVQTLYVMVKGLPLTYNRDLQEDKPPVFDSFAQTFICLKVLAASLADAEPNRQRCAAAVQDPALLATDLVDHLVERGVSFRDAHHAIGALVALAEDQGVKLSELSTKQVRSVNENFGDDWASCFELQRALRKREKFGMPGPDMVAGQILEWKRRLEA